MNIKRLYLLLLSFVWFSSYAQTDSIQYFDGADRRAHIDNAAWYRKISKPDTGKLYLGTEYWMNGHVKSVGYALDTNFLYKIGKVTYYYKNGNKSGEGQFYSNFDQHVFGYKNKKWETWYPNGKPKEIWVYKIADDFTYDESFLMSFWDSTGKELTTKGNGIYYYTELTSTKDSLQKITFSGPIHQGRYDSIWHGYYNNSKLYSEEVYAQGKFIKGKSFDGAGNEYKYDSVETAPQFPGGDEELDKFINLNTPAPPDAKLVANVSVRFVVGRNGYTGNILEAHAPQYARAEVLRVIKLMPRFMPATTRGQPVDASYITQIPVPLTH